ncbi:hypothetical protein [Flavisphingomonas formosensis]|uniref:hypothetical protein n=1 Tax=Flavisphingomonas formosensis TaxID=861534 RepID=UPI0012FB1CDE|nr:hypothetical protein [Sphingomonas formosensis]
MITWLLIILLIAVIALLAYPHLQPQGDTGAPSPAVEDKSSTDGTGEPSAGPDSSRSRSLPADNRVLERPGNGAPAPSSAAEDQEANEVAAMVSQGVVKYDRATRGQQNDAAAPAQDAPQR